MENKENKEGIMCDCCGWGSKGSNHHKMAVLRWLLGIIILFVTFSLGIKIGEFKQEVKSQWGGSFQRIHDGYEMDAYRYKMMNGYRQMPITDCQITVPPTY